MAKKAIDIERLLVWAYRDQKVGLIVGRGAGLEGLEAAAAGIEWHGVSGDGVATVMRDGLLGCRVQSSGPAWGGSAEVAEDAETLHATVMTMPRRVRGMVAGHAKAGTRPDWRPGAVMHWEPKWGWTTDGKGRRRPAEYLFDPTGAIGRQPWWCEVICCDMPAELAAVRAVYSAWHEALAVLAGHFRSHHYLLREHAVTGPAVPPAPWLAKGA